MEDSVLLLLMTPWTTDPTTGIPTLPVHSGVRFYEPSVLHAAPFLHRHAHFVTRAIIV